MKLRNALFNPFSVLLQILREAHYDFNQHVWEQPWTAVFGAYDVEPGDTITFRINDPQATNVSTEGLSTTVPTLFSTCDSAGQISVSISKKYWLRHPITEVRSQIH